MAKNKTENKTNKVEAFMKMMGYNLNSHPDGKYFVKNPTIILKPKYSLEEIEAMLQ